MGKCKICGTDFCEGDFLDIGIGFEQVSANVPNCDCEYIEWLKSKGEIEEESI